MRIKKHEATGQFLKMGMAVWQDTRVSLVARGLLGTLWSLPEDKWDLSVEGLTKILPHTGRKRLQRSLRELDQFGYIRRPDKKPRNPDGTFSSSRIDLYNKPFPFGSVTGFNPKLTSLSVGYGGERAAPTDLSGTNNKPGSHLPPVDYPPMDNPLMVQPCTASPPTEEPWAADDKQSIHNRFRHNESIHKGSIALAPAKRGTVEKNSKKRNMFNDFEQRDYDYDVLERRLLTAQKLRGNDSAFSSCKEPENDNSEVSLSENGAIHTAE